MRRRRWSEFDLEMPRLVSPAFTRVPPNAMQLQMSGGKEESREKSYVFVLVVE
jgi:hypothetical protein